MIEKFADYEWEDDSLVKHRSTINVKSDEPEFVKILENIEKTDPTAVHSLDNLTKKERHALKELKETNDLIIKKADKGSTLVVMDKVFYRDKLILQDHLYTETYEKVEPNADTVCFVKLRELMHQHRDCVTDKEFKYITNFDWSTSNFYGLPKIHKCKSIIQEVQQCNSAYLHMETPNDLKVRPVVAGPNAPTQHLSELLEQILKPLVPYQKSFIKDDWDFIRKFPSKLDYPCKLYSCDITSLYTSIDIELGLTALDYWIKKLRHLIPSRFTNSFILDSARFVLSNNYFMFDDIMWHQLIGSAMGTIFAPPYACLTMGFLEETKLYPTLPLYFDLETCNRIIEHFFRYMDDGISPLPIEVDINVFLWLLNQLHPRIVFTIEDTSKSTYNGVLVQKLNFLDITIMLHPSGKVETDVFYKETNNHDYLDFGSHHPSHIKRNIPYNLAKRIIVFCSNSDTEQTRLNELKHWLLACNYPLSVVLKGFHNAKLQGPAPNPDLKEVTLPFVTTHYCNYDSQNITQRCNTLLRSSKNERVNEVFANHKTVLALKQPPNLLRQLTRAKFSSDSTATGGSKIPGLFKCSRGNCKLCKLYIQECTSFQTANNVEWHIKSNITCQSKNVIYFLKCICCNLSTSYIGKTKCFRARMNNHISECRSGNTSDIFDRHVFKCKEINDINQEPYFQIFAFMTVSRENLLIPYESYLQSKKFDTLNC